MCVRSTTGGELMILNTKKKQRHIERNIKSILNYNGLYSSLETAFPLPPPTLSTPLYPLSPYISLAPTTTLNSPDNFDEKWCFLSRSSVPPVLVKIIHSFATPVNHWRGEKGLEKGEGEKVDGGERGCSFYGPKNYTSFDCFIAQK